MPIGQARLHAAVETLHRRPGHSNVMALVRELCVVGLDIPDKDVDFEIPVPEVRGRMDALLGSTVFEFKRDLRREQGEAEDQLFRYLGDRERATGRRYLGVATDGAAFIAYQLAHGRLVKLGETTSNAADPRALLRWLDTAVTVRANVPPSAETIREEFGRDGLVFLRSMATLAELWEAVSEIPEAALKRRLWEKHLEFVYGTLVEPNELFLQHTYLTIIAKTMAVRALVTGPVASGELLAGTPFTRVGLNGAVEADFFDWVLLAAGGSELVDRIAAQVARFRLSEIDVDILKAIYESLIDPRQRHYLGEYYTPDWLAEWICAKEITDPLSTHILDPACGSGTFLFHAVRRFLAAADDDGGLSVQQAIDRCTDHIFGLDVHPVAVLFSRVSYLLAIGPERLRARSGQIFIPVYLGDSLQWDVREFLTEEMIEIAVPGEAPLRFPGAVAGDPHLLELTLQRMSQLADRNASEHAFSGWLNANTTLATADRQILLESYEKMRALHETGRDHIWTFVVRNLTRPLWLSLRNAKPDLLIGNPPWLRFNAMSKEMQARFRQASKRRGIWVGGKVATHQDLSGYFFARCVERYLKRDGNIAFVMPLAALSRLQYQGFRSGRFGEPRGQIAAIVRFDEAWTFDSDAQRIFEVPCCVLFGHRDVVGGRLPQTVRAFRGTLPTRDVRSEEARERLSDTIEPWPPIAGTGRPSPYRNRFRQGATVVPRRFFLVESAESGRFGVDRSTPFVRGRVGSLDKRPWRDLTPFEGQIEREFLFPLLLGESIAPFRVLHPFEAIIPWDRGHLIDSQAAVELGHMHLSTWLRNAEQAWNTHKVNDMTLNQRIDYQSELRSQFPISSLRVVYAKAGIYPAATIIDDERSLIDHMLYWAIAKTRDEALYLVAILNSEAARERVETLQSEGLYGPRHFDKYMLSLPIPQYRADDRLHRELALEATGAEQIAMMVDVSDRGFQAARRAIRAAITSAGVARRIDELVERLLGTPSRGA
jgi:hypothetical protein